MLKKLMLATIASLVLVSGAASAARDLQEFHLGNNADDDIVVGEDGFPGYPGLESGLQNITKNTSRITFQTCAPLCVPFSLGDFWRGFTYPNGEHGSNCFPDEMVYGAIQIKETKNDGAKAQLWFDSIHQPTGTNVRYLLTLTDISWDGDFPPPVKFDSATMTANAWEMGTEGKGRYRNTSCKGGTDDGAPAATVTLKVTRID